jgi:hypothetical protein
MLSPPAVHPSAYCNSWTIQYPLLLLSDVDDALCGCGLHFGVASTQRVPVVHGPSLGGIPPAQHRDRLLLRPLARHGPHGLQPSHLRLAKYELPLSIPPGEYKPCLYFAQEA